jgi:hypothetical protein
MKTFERVLIGTRQTTAGAEKSYRGRTESRQVALEAMPDGGMPQ